MNTRFELNNRLAKSVPMALALGLVLAGSVMPSYAWPCWGHQRRNEVSRRDNFLNREINRERGDLSGHYGQLKAEDRAIRRQEQNDVRMNGGYLTYGQQRQLNREENSLQRQINRDDRF